MADQQAPAPPRLRALALRSPLSGPYDFELAAGACAVISGPSGSGKSLFLRMIADLDPNQGQVWCDAIGRETVSGPQWRRMVPYVAADSGWWREDVAGHFAEGQRQAARELADRLGLTDGQFDGAVARLSTGERQRLAIIRALVLEPPVLLLDEPTSALDADSAGRVEAVLKQRLDGGAAVLMVSHDPGQAARLAAAAYEMVERKLGPAR